jgi:hypothetical protein
MYILLSRDKGQPKYALQKADVSAPRACRSLQFGLESKIVGVVSGLHQQPLIDSFVGRARCRLVRIADDQNHSRPESLRIPVIASQSGHCGLVGTRNRVESFALPDFVLNHARAD